MMKTLLVNGCYDLTTLKNLVSLGAVEFSFDLRSTSTNLIPYHQLLILLKEIHSSQIYLTFENDKKETILSFLNLLKNWPFQFELIFRDVQPLEYYQALGEPFYWMFQPAGDWRGILNLDNLKGIFLPLKWLQDYEQMDELWRLIDVRNLQVYLHADTFSEALHLKLSDDLNLSIDLTREIEKSYRVIDQDRLKNLKFWRKLNESPLS